MYSGKIAVPPGGGGIRKKKLLETMRNKITGLISKNNSYNLNVKALRFGGVTVSINILKIGKTCQ
jgi:hypothetical protein